MAAAGAGSRASPGAESKRAFPSRLLTSSTFGSSTAEAAPLVEVRRQQQQC